MDPRILVTAVDLPRNQVTFVDKRTGKYEVYTLDPIAQVTVDDHPANLKDVKVGEQVFNYIEHDARSLDTLTVGKAKPAPTGSNLSKSQKVPATLDSRILITAVDAAQNQITFVDNRIGKTSVYTLDFLARVTLNGNPGSIQDLKVGEQVFTYIEHDAHSLDVLSVGTADIAAAGAKAAVPKTTPSESTPQTFVTAVDPSRNQVTFTNKSTGQTYSYTLDFLAEITIDNQPATIKNIKSGQMIYSYVAHDARSLDCLKLGTPDHASGLSDVK